MNAQKWCTIESDPGNIISLCLIYFSKTRCFHWIDKKNWGERRLSWWTYYTRGRRVGLDQVSYLYYLKFDLLTNLFPISYQANIRVNFPLQVGPRPRKTWDSRGLWPNPVFCESSDQQRMRNPSNPLDIDEPERENWNWLRIELD